MDKTLSAYRELVSGLLMECGDPKNSFSETQHSNCPTFSAARRILGSYTVQSLLERFQESSATEAKQTCRD
jgi:hypothetical protein